jgi:hypothetical protein
MTFRQFSALYQASYNGLISRQGECYFPAWVNPNNKCFFYYMDTTDKGSVYIYSYRVEENSISYYVTGKLYYFKSGEWEYPYSSTNYSLTVNKNNLTEITSSSGKKYYRYKKGDIDVVVDEQGVSYSPNDDNAPFNDLDGDGISNDEDNNNYGSNNNFEGTYEEYKAYIRRSALEAYIEKINNDPDSPYSLSIKGHYSAGEVVTIDGKEYTFNEDFYLLKRDYGGLSNNASYVIVPDSSNGIRWYDDNGDGGDNTYIEMFLHNGTVNGSPIFSKEPTIIFHSELDLLPYGGTGGGSGTGGNDTGGSDTGGGDTGGSGTGGSGTGGNDTGGNGTGGNGTGGNDTGGNDTGGNDTGGSDTGGSDTGGSDTGGGGTGGNDTGGNDTGGTGNEGNGNGNTIIINDPNDSSVSIGDGADWYPSNELNDAFVQLRKKIYEKFRLDIYEVFSGVQGSSFDQVISFRFQVPSIGAFSGSGDVLHFDFDINEVWDYYPVSLIRLLLVAALFIS